MSTAAEQFFARAVAAHQSARLAEADDLYSAVLAIAPSHATTLSNRGDVRNKQGRFIEALADLDTALDLVPDYASAHNNRGNALRGLKRYDEARAAFAAALRFKPDFVDAQINLAGALVDAKRHDEALAIYDRVLASQPGLTMALFNRAKALTDLGRFDAALKDYDAVIARGQEFADLSRFAAGMIKLRQGNFAEGWRLYEARWSTDALPRHDAVPLWRGEDIAGKTILIHGEQGFGDTIQFARYIPMVRARGAHVVTVLQPELTRVLAPVLEGCTNIAPGAPLPPFDTYCLLMSLPLAFGTTLETIPAPIPYVAAPELKLMPSSRKRIGLAWSGRPTHVNDLNRSIPLALLAPLLAIDAEFHAIQKDIRAEDRNPRIITHDLGDFADTAVLIASTDVVVSVDTSVAHLAGAMGKPVNILLPYAADFRWLVGRTDSPWYPTATLYRQPTLGDWPGAIAAVTQAIKNPGV